MGNVGGKDYWPMGLDIDYKLNLNSCGLILLLIQIQKLSLNNTCIIYLAILASTYRTPKLLLSIINLLVVYIYTLQVLLRCK